MTNDLDLHLIRDVNVSLIRLRTACWVTGCTSATNVEASAGQGLAALVNRTSSGATLVVDCVRVNTIVDHAFDALKKAISQCLGSVVFANCEALGTDLVRELGDAQCSYMVSQVRYKVYGSADSSTRVNTHFMGPLARAEAGVIEDDVRSSFFKHDVDLRQLQSTPILASGVFDARRIISRPPAFARVASALARKIESDADPNGADGPFEKPRLLAVSLRGAPLAAAVADLTNWRDVEVVDHLGPRYQLLEEHSFRQSYGYASYAYVGDFVIGGTELRIAQSYARSKGAELRHAYVIGAALPVEAYKPIDLYALVNLVKCQPLAVYKFAESAE